nr:glutathione binding-like protein [Sphingomonas sp. CDS-1]
MQRDYITVEQAVPLAGLRIAFTQSVPGPWSESAKAFFHIKGIDYQPVIQVGGQPNPELQAWTGQNSAPCAVLDDERPRSHWSEILMLAERMQPEPRLVPQDEDERVTMFGIAHELCGEDGFGWSVRLLMLHIMEQTNAGVPIEHMRRKFSSGAPLDHAASRAGQILDMLARRAEKQRASGSDYLVGDALTAADIYWTCFSNLVASMDEADCPMPQFYRDWAAGCVQLIGRPVPEILIAHRERILRRHFSLPMWF